MKISLEQDFFNTNGWNVIRSGSRGPADHSSSSVHTLSSGRLEYDPGNGISTFLRGDYYQEYRDLGTAFRSSSATRGFINGGGSYDDNMGDLFSTSIYSHLSTYHENFSTLKILEPSRLQPKRKGSHRPTSGDSCLGPAPFLEHHTLAAGGDFRFIDGTSYDNFFNTAGTAIDDHIKSSGKQQFYGLYARGSISPIGAA